MRSLFAGLAVGGLLVVLSACTPQPPELIEVQITLTDFGIESPLSTFEVGQSYHLVINNQGALNHELMVMEPMMGGMEMSMEEMDEMALAMIEEDDLPPGSTQTLDITFIAAKFDEAGNKVKNAHLPKVLLNGELIHDQVELKHGTGNNYKLKEHTKAPILIQVDHGPVAFRNIKVRELNQ